MLEFQKVQQQFIQHIKDPSQTLPAGIAAERMAVYSELFFNNVLNFVSGAFPVLSSLYAEQVWQRKVRHFYQQTALESPYFLDIAASFLEWLQHSLPEAEDAGFMTELAHYEWVELYLATKHQQVDMPQCTDLFQPLCLSEEALVLSYQYPVHQISVDFQPTAPSDTGVFLLVYRNLDDAVKFMVLNQLTASLLQSLVLTPGLNLSQLVAQLAPQIPQIPLAQLTQGACTLMQELAQKAVIRTFQTA